ncbi:general odorant-binding protein 56d-like [Phlebotomus argentipes]|uniref:general odorant-binding protein 56d-like n=1 Tax=Phlebotomus argentipes TaxID=94469 RepID=UPI002893809E|nr:general odorant-binding protein 56d-like [Phlebotomus argentipes]
MKTVVTFALALFWIQTVLAQDYPPSIANVILPCAKESGSTDSDWAAIQKGDFRSVKDLFGCFADCILKKVGVITPDDVFHADVFKQRVSLYLNDAHAQEFTDRCASQFGTEKCKVSGKVHACLIMSIMGNLFAA